MKVICISGTPGAGKTMLARKLSARLKFYYLDVNKLILKKKLSKEYDKKRKSKIIDTKKLNAELIDVIKSKKLVKTKGLVIDSHLSHYLPKKYANLCIIVKCDIKTLNRRLVKRGYSKPKIQENLQAEIFDVCHEEAFRMRHKIFLVDGAKSFNMSEISKFIIKSLNFRA